jgi:chemotaxis protein methyltransferase CheR
MRPENLDYLAAWLQERTGFALGRDQMHLVEGRLFPVARKFATGDLDALVGELRSGKASDLPVDVADAMMSTETAFFRDPAVFAGLRDRGFPALMATRAADRRLRIWCAGVSTGQEAYSLAMLARHPALALDGWQVEIIATDVSRQAIERARAGSYSHFEIQAGLPARLMVENFRRQQERWMASEPLRRAVVFKEHNLLAEAGAPGRCDLVLCRYVLRSCAEEPRAAILGRIIGQIVPGGLACLGLDEAGMATDAGLAPVDGAPGLFVVPG